MTKQHAPDPAPGQHVSSNTPQSLPLDNSAGYQIRATHRLMQRALQARIEQHGVTLGMWYFLRVLWDQDGITQSELSRRTGTMEPTALSAIRDMEREGIVERVRDPADGRKINVFLTDRGRGLEALLLPLAIEVVDRALIGITKREHAMLLDLLACVQQNLQELQ